MTPNRSLDRISTGNDELDLVLGGGIPVHSIVVIAGESGSGKTVLSLEVLFDAARKGQRGIYFSTLSEPAAKVIRYMQLLDFFDEALVGDRIILADLGSVLRQDGAEAALSMLIERVETDRPAVVVVDSFRAFHDLIEPGRQRSFVYDLAVIMAGWGATTLLVGEYTDAEILTFPEFAIADGILRMGASRSELSLVREMEVRKLRGSDHLTGSHFFDLDRRGLHLYPRVRPPDVAHRQAMDIDRVSTGIAGLDGILRGGLPASSTTIVAGGTGTGKTVLALSFLLDGANRGERSVLLGLEETPGQLRDTARTFGWDLEAYEKSGLLTILYASPVELLTDRFLHRALRVIRASDDHQRARRVVLDSMTSLELGAQSQRRFKELVYALAKHLRAEGATSLMSMEVTEQLGSGMISGHGISFAADNLILMRYLEVEGRLDRGITVIKARGITHGSELHELVIDDNGLRVGKVLRGLQSVFTELPENGRQAGGGQQT